MQALYKMLVATITLGFISKVLFHQSQLTIVAMAIFPPCQELRQSHVPNPDFKREAEINSGFV